MKGGSLFSSHMHHFSISFLENLLDIGCALTNRPKILSKTSQKHIFLASIRHLKQKALLLLEFDRIPAYEQPAFIQKTSSRMIEWQKLISYFPSTWCEDFATKFQENLHQATQIQKLWNSTMITSSLPFPSGRTLQLFKSHYILAIEFCISDGNAHVLAHVHASRHSNVIHYAYIIYPLQFGAKISHSECSCEEGYQHFVLYYLFYSTYGLCSHVQKPLYHSIMGRFP